jgi:hypothetical protein
LTKYPDSQSKIQKIDHFRSGTSHFTAAALSRNGPGSTCDCVKSFPRAIFFDGLNFNPSIFSTSDKASITLRQPYARLKTYRRSLPYYLSTISKIEINEEAQTCHPTVAATKSLYLSELDSEANAPARQFLQPIPHNLKLKLRDRQPSALFKSLTLRRCLSSGGNASLGFPRIASQKSQTVS